MKKKFIALWAIVLLVSSFGSAYANVIASNAGKPDAAYSNPASPQGKVHHLATGTSGTSSTSSTLTPLGEVIIGS